MSINYVALKVEIAKPAYNGMSDATIAATINAQTVPGFVSVSVPDARNALMFTTTNDWGWLAGVNNGSITSANASGAGAVVVTAATRRLANTLYDFLSMNLPLPMNSARASLLHTLINALVTANVITTAGQNAMEAVPQVTLAGWTQFGDRSLDYNDIAIARAS